MKKRLISLLLTGVMVVSMLAGCGGSGDEKTAETPQAEAQRDGKVEITLGAAMGWDTLTPFRDLRAWSIQYSRMLYDSLAFMTPDGVLNPVVAKSWEVQEDGKTWDVEIYDYVYDSEGNHITADDIVWIIETQIPMGQKSFYNFVESVEKTGDYTFQVKMTDNQYGVFESLLMLTLVVSKDAYEKSEDEFNTSVVSTSPYLVTDFVSGSSITLEKRDDYWQKEELIPESMAYNVDKLTVKLITESSQQQIALETGEVDGFIGITQSLLPAFADGYEICGVTSMAGTVLQFTGNESSPVAMDENLRKAIAYAIDEEGLIEGVFAGYAEKMYGTESSGTIGFNESWKEEDNYFYDMDKAKEHLEQSNYNGETLSILASSSTTNERICTMIQSYLGELGINVKLNLVERALYSTQYLDPTTYDLLLVNTGSMDQASLYLNFFDMNSLEVGDHTGRKDEELTNLVYQAGTNAGFTEENIDKVHDYLQEHLYTYGICQPQQCDVYRSDLGITEQRTLFGGSVDFVASSYGN